MKNEISVKCMVRIRPLSKKETNEGAENCVLAAGNCIESRDNRFTYDSVFPIEAEQIEGKLLYMVTTYCDLRLL